MTVEAAMHEASLALADHGMQISPSRLRRLVNRYQGNQSSFRNWFLNEVGVIDPTGQTAVRNVDRERAR